ncbi:alpha-(1-_3)-arabinofuranosyltransferase [Williamsia phyllosphaerae]|uniref:alpha-(1->3)-arabinofuranosyltransferase n=1 Tax=Williamsia phyllosphaerae TaxID=885042 RepID=UPI001E57AD42|nr:alpha-(1->3)-arabinofuranosyltransferase family protein [Williamsia phyllosphaerae]
MDDQRLTRRGVVLAAVAALVFALVQSPGAIAADTKLDLTADPVGFLARATHLWTSQATLGQVQNQAYGYFFPHGAFFVLGDVVGLSPWITQRLWWAVLVFVGFLGIVRLAEALGIGSRGSRIVAAAAFVLSPRVLTTLGSISSETTVMMLAPWVLIPVVIALDHPQLRSSLRQLAFRSACAVALMGAVNAVATLAACGIAVVWWLAHAPVSFGSAHAGPAARWVRFTGWWALGVALACAWWIVPLLILSRVSPPFLDFIESSRVTTEWTSLTEVLRGTSSWTPFVSPERVAGSLLVNQPAAVVATGVVAAAGLAGLAMRRMPGRGRLVTALVVGLLLMCLGFAGQLGSPVAEPIRVFLDGAGAPLRNVHKFDPMIRVPLVLGIAHLIARIPLPGTVSWPQAGRAAAHPERSPALAATMALLVAVVGAGSLVWTGRIAPQGTYDAIPDYWSQTADWLKENSGPAEHPERSLVVPGAPLADQSWGLTRDEPLQPLADVPWAVRDAIPLVPPGAIRALDSVQRLISSGRGSAGMAATLARQGVGYVVLRADLDPTASRSARPILAQQALTSSPGLVRVARFGPEVGPRTIKGIVGDDGLAPRLPAIQIFAVRSASASPDGTATGGTGPSLVDLDAMPRIVGGPESLARLQDHAARTGATPLGPTLLDADARRAGVDDSGASGAIVTDTPTDRETDFGRVDDHSSAIRAPGDRRSTQNAVPDYPVPGAGLVRGQWLLDGAPDQVSVTASGSASDATQLGQTSPANSTAAAFDDDPNTSWISRGIDSAVGQWLQVNFTRPRSDLAVTVTPGKALGAPVTSLLVTTEAGSSVAQGITPGAKTTIVAPSGPTRWIQVRAIGTDNNTAGSQFAVAEMSLTDTRAGADLAIRHSVVLPPLVAGRAVAGWDLGTELGGRTACAADTDVTRCSAALALAPEEPGVFTRVLSVPESVDVAPRVWLRSAPGTALTTLLTAAGSVRAQGASLVVDPRGTASAAVDGDPRTAWIAPESTTTPGAAPPSLRLTLPAPQRVSAMTITRPRGLYPAAPVRVAVDLGTGRQVRTLPASGRITLDPAVTDRVSVTVLATADLIDVNSLGFAKQSPVGIAEITVDGAPPAPSPDRVVTVGCDAGVGLAVAGRVVPMTVTTTARSLLDGDPVPAVPCGADSLALPAGEQQVSITPGAAFTVDSATLTRTGPGSPGENRAQQGSEREQALAPQEWGADHRTVSVPASAESRVLVVPESQNPGWHARAGGQELTPIVVDGWQQGWIVPAGVAGTITLDYPLDRPYRWSLLIGLLAVAALFGATLIGRRRPTRDDRLPVATPIRAPLAAAGALVVALTLLTGWPGALAALATAAAGQWIRRRRPRALPLVVAALFTLAAAGLSLGPWQSPSGYTGFSWWVQLPALAALTLVAAGALPASRSVAVWRRSLRRRSASRIARRAGSSIRP